MVPWLPELIDPHEAIDVEPLDPPEPIVPLDEVDPLDPPEPLVTSIGDTPAAPPEPTEGVAFVPPAVEAPAGWTTTGAIGGLVAAGGAIVIGRIGVVRAADPGVDAGPDGTALARGIPPRERGGTAG